MDKQVISDYMIEQNRLFHKIKPDYGTYGHKWTDGIRTLVKRYDIDTILDYGAGKQTLKTDFPDIQCYDPGILEISNPPEPADLVVCTHVLEHIEPDLFDNVLTHIQELTKKVFFIVVNPGRSYKYLPDGRDSNLIQESVPWWFKTVSFEGFNVSYINRRKFRIHGIVEEDYEQATGTFLGVRNSL